MAVPGTPAPGPVADVRTGMPVFDSDDERIGSVSTTKMGDPEALTPQGQQHPRGLVEGIVEAFTGTEPDVPPQRAAQLLRSGYIRIDAKGFFARDLYASADEIDRVDDGGVHLSVPRNWLVPES